MRKPWPAITEWRFIRCFKSTSHPWINKCILVGAEHLKYCCFFIGVFFLHNFYYCCSLRTNEPFNYAFCMKITAKDQIQLFSFSQLFSQVIVIFARARAHPSPSHTRPHVCVHALLCSQGRFASARHCSPALPPAAGDRSPLWLPKATGPPSISRDSMASLYIRMHVMLQKVDRATVQIQKSNKWTCETLNSK